MNLVFLPATDVTDTSYVQAPEGIQDLAGFETHSIRYPRLVWYNKSVQDEAISQIRSIDAASVVLVGFSKSGPGAWNIARRIPDIVSATIIFDAPVARNALPSWGTAPFYKDDASWQEDLPLRTVEEFHAAMPDTHHLVLISGPGFHEEMRELSGALTETGSKHTFLAREHLQHHWNSGWIEDGLKCIFGSGTA